MVDMDNPTGWYCIEDMKFEIALPTHLFYLSIITIVK